MRNDYINNIFENNYKTLTVTTSYTDKYIEKCYCLGIIDGYMKEYIYKSLIDKQCGIISYERGYEKGINVRDRDFNKNVNIFKKKEFFLSKLAMFDALNSVTSRNLSDDARKIYDKYLVGEYDFKTSRIIPNK